MEALREALADLQAGRIDEAARKARQLLEGDASGAEPHHIIGLALLLGGQPAEALPFLETAQGIAPEEPRYAFSVGLALNRLERLEESILAYRRALTLRPGHVETLANLGSVLQRAGQLGEAADHYAAALRQRPGHARLLNALGLCQLRTMQPEAAEASFTAAVKADPDFAEAHLHRSLALARLERGTDALAAVREAIRLEPNAPDAWFNLGECLYLEGSLAAARQAFERVLSLEPNDAVARHRLSAIKGESVERPPDAYVRALFDGFAPTFDKRLIEHLDYGVPGSMAAFLEPWGSQRGAPLKVLDLGCGTGLSGKALRPMASELVGVDLASEMLARARARGVYDVLHQASLVDFLAAEPPGRWDLVVAMDVFIYVGRLDDVFRAAARALCPGGLFAFSVELLEGAPGFRLQRTARYAHSREYLESMAALAGFEPWGIASVELRKEAGQPLAGLLAGFAKRGV